MYISFTCDRPRGVADPEHHAGVARGDVQVRGAHTGCWGGGMKVKGQERVRGQGRVRGQERVRGQGRKRVQGRVR